MTNRKTYTRRQKLAAVLAADLTGVVQVEKQTGIPESTIRYWLDDPEFAEFRAKAREEMAEEVKVVAHLAWRRIAKTIDTMEPRDALFAAEKATTLHLLMSGEATARTEHRDITVDDDTVAAIEGVLAGVAGPFAAGMEPRRNGAGANGKH